MSTKRISWMLLVALLGMVYSQQTELRVWGAEKLFELKNFWPQGTRQSQILLDYAIWLNPKVGKYYMEKSVPFNKRGEYAEGMYYLNQAVALQPTHFLGYRGWLKLYLLHDYKGSLQDLTQLDTLTPGFVDYPWGENIYFLLGLNYLQLKQWEQAVTYFTMAARVERKDRGESFVNPFNYLYKSIAFNEQGLHTLALQNLDSMQRIQPKSSELYYFKALVYAKQQRATAESFFQRADSLYRAGYHSWNSYYSLPYPVDSFIIAASRAQLYHQ